jgi:hypothetical protein
MGNYLHVSCYHFFSATLVLGTTLKERENLPTDFTGWALIAVNIEVPRSSSRSFFCTGGQRKALVLLSCEANGRDDRASSQSPSRSVDVREEFRLLKPSWESLMQNWSPCTVATWRHCRERRTCTLALLERH